MGIASKTIVRGDINVTENGEVNLTGTTSNGIPCVVSFSSLKDGKSEKIKIEEFSSVMSDLVSLSANAYKEKHNLSDDDIKQDIANRLKKLNKGKEVSFLIENGTSIFVASPNGGGQYLINATASKIDLPNGNVFYPVKIIEESKNGTDYTPIMLSSVKGMVYKREEFAKLSQEEKDNIAYNKEQNSDKFRFKNKLTVRDIQLGNYDASTVSFEACLNTNLANTNHLIAVAQKEENYLRYMVDSLGKKFEPTSTKFNSKNDAIVVPRTRFNVSQQKIFELTNTDSLSSFLKKIIAKANESGEYYIPFTHEDGKVVKINHTNLDTYGSASIIRQIYQTILKQFDGKLTSMVMFAGIEKQDDLTMKYIELVDKLKASENVEKYMENVARLIKQTKKDGLSTTPLNIYFPLKTRDYKKVMDNPEYAKKHKQEMKKFLDNLASSVEKGFLMTASVYSRAKDSLYVSNIKHNIDEKLAVMDGKFVYMENDKGFTVSDRMPLKNSCTYIKEPTPYAVEDSVIQPLGYTLLGVSPTKENSYVGIDLDRLESLSTKKLLNSELGVGYVVLNKKGLTVDEDNVPTISNPFEKGSKTIRVRKPRKQEQNTEQSDNVTPANETAVTENVSIPTTIDDIDNEVSTTLEDNIEVENADIDETPQEVEVVETSEMSQEALRQELDMSTSGIIDGLDLAILQDFVSDNEMSSALNLKTASEIQQQNVGKSTLVPSQN